MLNEEGQVVLGHIIHRCRVSEFQALPDLDAGANAIALEHIKLENKGWKINDELTIPCIPKPLTSGKHRDWRMGKTLQGNPNSTFIK